MKNKEAIQDILRRHDPVELIAQGAPDDEYDYIADKILSLSAEKGEDELANSIYQIFTTLFDENLAGDKRKYLILAKEILS